LPRKSGASKVGHAAPLDEVETVKALVKECLEGAYALSVPLEAEVSVGGNWRDME
jgi:DNA polymerase I-like protein with 3'-5' exonuclease and polymerase domains